MKRLSVGVALAVLCSAGAVADTWEVEGETRADFLVQFSGEVPKRCVMTAEEDLKSLEFNLNYASDVQTFKFKTWCNTYGNKGIVQVDPFAFENSNKDVIPMQYEFNQTKTLFEKGSSYDAVRISKEVEISNNINKEMNITHQVNITSLPQEGARWGKYAGSMYVTLYSM